MRGHCLILGILLVSSGVQDNRRAAAGDTESKPARPHSSKILFLGVYHMSNPALDDNDVLADDILSPKRQRELQELVEKFAPYQPTKICVEAPYRGTAWSERYQKYLAGSYKMGRSEVEQIGFRLAKRLDLKTLYGFDYPMFMSGLTPAELEWTKPPAAHRTSGIPRVFSAEDRLLRNSTLTAYLRHLNSEDFIQADHREYLLKLLPTADPAIYAKTDMVLNWYKHNLRMFTNLNRIVDIGKDRVLVIVGSGHLKLLREFAHEAPYYTVVDAEEFLKP
jgi:Family of unknown function (DUF5694)